MKETTADISAGKQVTNCSCENAKSIEPINTRLVRPSGQIRQRIVNKLSATLVKAEGPAG